MATRLVHRLRSKLLHNSALFQSSLHLKSPILSHVKSPGFIPSQFSDVRLLSGQSIFTIPRLRFFSTARRHLSRSKVDIGARARQLQNRRLWTYALTFSCIAGFVVIVINNFQDSMVFYVTPTDAMEKYALNPTKNKFRLGGLVLEGSVAHPASSPEMEFVITDLITDILVRYKGTLPDLFREGHSVVVEGFVKPFTDEIKKEVSEKNGSGKAGGAECYFAATEVLAKHDEKYMPKEVAAALERNKKMLEAGRDGGEVAANNT